MSSLVRIAIIVISCMFVTGCFSERSAIEEELMTQIFEHLKQTHVSSIATNSPYPNMVRTSSYYDKKGKEIGYSITDGVSLAINIPIHNDLMRNHDMFNPPGDAVLTSYTYLKSKNGYTLMHINCRTEHRLASLKKYYNGRFADLGFAQSLEWTDDNGELKAQFFKDNITIDANLEKNWVSLCYVNKVDGTGAEASALNPGFPAPGW